MISSYFCGNNATGFGGAIYSHNSIQLLIQDNNLQSNNANNGGGLCGVFCSEVSAINNSFLENNAISSGSGLWLSACNINTLKNKFENNIAKSGRGTIFWKHTSGMNEPPEILERNQFLNNHALHGNTLATEAYDAVFSAHDHNYLLQLQSQNLLSYDDYDQPLNSISLQIIDFYGNFCPDDSFTTIKAGSISYSSCLDNVAQLSGSVIEQAVEGTVRTSFCICNS